METTTREHAVTGFCQRCWNDAYLRMLDEPGKSQTEHYHDLLAESGEPRKGGEG